MGYEVKAVPQWSMIRDLWSLVCSLVWLWIESGALTIVLKCLPLLPVMTVIWGTSDWDLWSLICDKDQQGEWMEMLWSLHDCDLKWLWPSKWWCLPPLLSGDWYPHPQRFGLVWQPASVRPWLLTCIKVLKVQRLLISADSWVYLH